MYSRSTPPSSGFWDGVEPGGYPECYLGLVRPVVPRMALLCEFGFPLQAGGGKVDYLYLVGQAVKFYQILVPEHLKIQSASACC